MINEHGVSATDLTAQLIAQAKARAIRIAVAESLTGGLLAAELIRIPGASAVVAGGIVAYDTQLKNTLLGVDADLLASGAVQAMVATQMASGVCDALAVAGKLIDIGVATTGAAGPEPQDGANPGTVFIAVHSREKEQVQQFNFRGDRAAIRSQTVTAAIKMVLTGLE